MVIRVSEIPDEGLRVDSVSELLGVFTDEGWSLDGVALKIQRQGGEVAVTGTFRATARLACSRCLEPLVSAVAPEVDLHLLPSPSVAGGPRHQEVELGVDDLEVDFYQGDTLDVARLLQSETQLALPMKPLCRSDCGGLCPICGGNRNLTACECAPRRVDPRLYPLEALKRPR
jgi:uncharacterized protein